MSKAMTFSEPAHDWERRRTTWWTRLLGRLGRRYWVSRIDYVLSEAKQAGRINNDLLHELDGRLKYYPGRSWQ